MLRNAEILQPQLLRRRRHFLERVMPVARGGVAMKCAAQIFFLDQSRQRVFFGGFEFAVVFAQLRRNKIKTESAIKFRFVARPAEFSPPSLFRFCRPDRAAAARADIHSMSSRV